MFERILVASDLASTSEGALRKAVELAVRAGGTLFVLHVSEKPELAGHWLVMPLEGELDGLRALMSRHEAVARDRLVGQVQRLTAGEEAPVIEYLFRWGRPAETIVAEALRLDADVIVVGTRGNHFGSVAERVVTTAGRPALVVPSSGS